MDERIPGEELENSLRILWQRSLWRQLGDRIVGPRERHSSIESSGVVIDLRTARDRRASTPVARREPSLEQFPYQFSDHVVGATLLCPARPTPPDALG